MRSAWPYRLFSSSLEGGSWRSSLCGEVSGFPGQLPSGYRTGLFDRADDDAALHRTEYVRKLWLYGIFVVVVLREARIKSFEAATLGVQAGQTGIVIETRRVRHLDTFFNRTAAEDHAGRLSHHHHSLGPE